MASTVTNPSGKSVLYFAGEHTSSKYPATVHGAYNSGIDAATKLDNYVKTK